MPVASAFAPFAAVANNTVKGCKWSPDGLCLLTASEEDKQLRLFELPGELQSEATLGAAAAAVAERGAAANGAASAEIESTLTVREGDSIYDFAWFPGMDSAEPATCCFLSSSREHPLHLWDAYTGQCRASYSARNHLDELTAAHSLAFDPSGSKIYAGFDRAVRIFDVSRPGRQCELRPTCKTKRSRSGQRGIISCFAFAPDYWGLYAAGSFSGTTGMYDERDPSNLIVELGTNTREGSKIAKPRAARGRVENCETASSARKRQREEAAARGSGARTQHAMNLCRWTGRRQCAMRPSR